ncbi:MAG: hypothetical protein FJ405_18735, partial [Verrucomicrobia bacterium]|nr:hypothetical protein [Verrucomicrobiota bacterium]
MKLLPLVGMILVVCAHLASGAAAYLAPALPEGTRMLGRIQAPSLKESSGVVVSSRNPQILWSHGDGRVPLLYSMERNGKALGSVSIARVQLVDWEDLASDRGGKF